MPQVNIHDEALVFLELTGLINYTGPAQDGDVAFIKTGFLQYYFWAGSTLTADNYMVVNATGMSTAGRWVRAGVASVQVINQQYTPTSGSPYIPARCSVEIYIDELSFEGSNLLNMSVTLYENNASLGSPFTNVDGSIINWPTMPNGLWVTYKEILASNQLKIVVKNPTNQDIMLNGLDIRLYWL